MLRKLLEACRRFWTAHVWRCRAEASWHGSAEAWESNYTLRFVTPLTPETREHAQETNVQWTGVPLVVDRQFCARLTDALDERQRQTLTFLMVRAKVVGMSAEKIGIWRTFITSTGPDNLGVPVNARLALLRRRLDGETMQ